MKGFIFKISKHKEIDLQLDNVFQMINDLKECNHTFEYDIDENILAISYTNEPVMCKAKYKSYFFTYSGQLAKSFEKIKNDLVQYNPATAKNYIKDIAGAFSIGFVHFPTKTVRVFTHFARVNPVYYFENDENIVIGTDPLIVQTVAYNSGLPLIAVNQSVSFLINGYYTDNETIFKEVKAVPENTEVIIENGKVLFQDIDNSVKNMFTKKATKEDFDELTELYLRAYEVIPESNTPHRIGLTGGKDSRLIALGLLENDIPFKASTRGFDDHPDVLIAKEIAKKLNIEHTINTPVVNKANELEIDLVDKILNTMIGTSGNVFGYENIKYNPQFQNRIGLTGVGAECVRGGYGNHSKKNSTQIESELIKSFFGLKKYINAHYQNEYERFLIGLGKNETSFKEVQCKHYIFYRVGRWAGGTRNSVLYTADMYSPFFDNQFLKKATELEINTLIGEEVHYNIMQRLNPGIAKMGFFASRWSFEGKGPKNPNQYKEWLKRNPVYAKTQLGAYNWRALSNPDATLRNTMREILLSNSNDEIFEIVNYKQVAQILNKPVPTSLNKFIWSLASIKLYKDYLAKKQNYSIPMTHLKIPSGEIKKVDNQPQIRDLTNTIIPINKAMHKIVEKNGLKFIKNKEGTGNLYIQTGDGPIAKPPIDSHDILNVQGYKQIFVRFCLEAPIPVDYDVYIMFYNRKERISSERIKVKYIKNRMYIDKSINVDENAIYMKIAINFKTKTDDWEVQLKYGYLEIK